MRPGGELVDGPRFSDSMRTKPHPMRSCPIGGSIPQKLIKKKRLISPRQMKRSEMKFAGVSDIRNFLIPEQAKRDGYESILTVSISETGAGKPLY